MFQVYSNFKTVTSASPLPSNGINYKIKISFKDDTTSVYLMTLPLSLPPASPPSIAFYSTYWTGGVVNSIDSVFLVKTGGIKMRWFIDGKTTTLFY